MGNPLKSDVSDESEDDVQDVDVPSRNKDICILEIDDVEDLEIISLILEPSAPEGFHCVNTQSLPGLTDLEIARNLQMFTQVWRAKFPTSQKVGTFPKHFLRLLQTIFFKLRSMIPCAICDLKFRLDLPEGVCHICLSCFSESDSNIHIFNHCYYCYDRMNFRYW